MIKPIRQCSRPGWWLADHTLHNFCECCAPAPCIVTFVLHAEQYAGWGCVSRCGVVRVALAEDHQTLDEIFLASAKRLAKGMQAHACSQTALASMYDALRRTSTAWKKLQRERQVWEGANLDGLDKE